MITKEETLNSIQFVVNNSKYVKIKEENIENAINLVTNNEKKSWLNSDLLDFK